MKGESAEICSEIISIFKSSILTTIDHIFGGICICRCSLIFVLHIIHLNEYLIRAKLINNIFEGLLFNVSVILQKNLEDK